MSVRRGLEVTIDGQRVEAWVTRIEAGFEVDSRPTATITFVSGVKVLDLETGDVVLALPGARDAGPSQST